MKALKISVLAAIFSLVACEKEIDLQLPAENKLLTLDARLSTGDSIIVLAGLSASVLESSGPVTDNQSKIYLYENDVLKDSLKPRLNARVVHPSGQIPYTYHSKLVPQAGNTYMIRIERDGFTTAFGSDKAPSSTPINNWHLDTAQQSISFSFFDQPNTKDYYLVEIIERTADQVNKHYFTSYDPTIEMLYTSGDGTDNGSTGRKALITDEFFNGSVKQLHLFYGDQLMPGNEYRLQLSHISKDYYLYELSKAVEESSDLQLFQDKANLHSNLSEGYGVVICSSPVHQIFIP